LRTIAIKRKEDEKEKTTENNLFFTINIKIMVNI
jgi:hypothetical protein